MKYKKLIILFSILGIPLLFGSAGLCQTPNDDIHTPLFSETEFPSAKDCQTCHPTHFKEWSVSPHAYAQFSPIFNAMSNKINELTNGTNGDFCIRCHTPVGMMKGEPTDISNLDRDPLSLEGVSCMVCHRRNKPYGKVSARFSPIPGDIHTPIYGPHDNEELMRVIHSGEFDVNAVPGKEGRAIHSDAYKFFQIVESGFCGSCHDVNHINGFRLEEAFSGYKASPAARKGISCQDCHMGKEPGIPSGYTKEPIAIVAGKPTKPRKKTNHMFVGPDYSVVHPGIFPHNTEAQAIASLREWLQFKFSDGWGTDDYEDTLEGDEAFPERWADASDRYEAREIIDENLDLIKEAAEQRKILLKHAYKLGDIKITKAKSSGIKFKIEIRNGTDGHGAPTGFDAERLAFLRVTIRDASGKTVYQSGDLDPNGDLRDSHSVYVHNGEAPLDKHLFSLQSKFIVRMLRGGEREQILAVNSSLSPLPFLRPAPNATLLTGRPEDSRKHRKTIAPLDSVWAKYKVSKKQLKNSQGPYTAHIQFITGMVPVNLVHAIHDVGFDYGMSAREVAKALVAGHQVLWEKQFPLEEGVIIGEEISSY